MIDPASKLELEKQKRMHEKNKSKFEVDLLQPYFSPSRLDIPEELDRYNYSHELRNRSKEVFTEAGSNLKTPYTVEAVAQSMFDSGFLSKETGDERNLHKLLECIYGVKVASIFNPLVECAKKLNQEGYNDHVGEQSPMKLYGKGDSEYCPGCDTDYDSPESDFTCDHCIQTKNQKRFFICGDYYASALITTNKNDKPDQLALILEEQNGMYSLVVRSERSRVSVSVIKISDNHQEKHRVKEFSELFKSRKLFDMYSEHSETWLNPRHLSYGVLCSVDLSSFQADQISDVFAIERSIDLLKSVETALFTDLTENVMRMLNRP